MLCTLPASGAASYAGTPTSERTIVVVVGEREVPVHVHSTECWFVGLPVEAIVALTSARPSRGQSQLHNEQDAAPCDDSWHSVLDICYCIVAATRS